MTKPLQHLQEHNCPGQCKREILEGDVCFRGSCEYNIHDPFNKEQKEELLKAQQPGQPLLPSKEVKDVRVNRIAMYPAWPTRKRKKKEVK